MKIYAEIQVQNRSVEDLSQVYIREYKKQI